MTWMTHSSIKLQNSFLPIFQWQSLPLSSGHSHPETDTKWTVSKQRVFYCNTQNCEILLSNLLSTSSCPQKTLLRLQRLMPTTAPQFALPFPPVSNPSWLDCLLVLISIPLITHFHGCNWFFPSWTFSLGCLANPITKSILPSVCSPPPPGLPRVTEKIE